MGPALAWPRPPWPPQSARLLPQDVLSRVSWSGARTREVWEPRLRRLMDVSLAVELDMVRTGALRVSVVLARYNELSELLLRVKELGLAAAPMHAQPDASARVADDRQDTTELLAYGLIVCGGGALESTLELLAHGSPAEIGAWFGYPACCAAAWADVLANRLTDPVSAAVSRGSTAVRVSDDPRQRGADQVLLACLGLGPIRHAPCSMQCDDSAEAARVFLASAAHFPQEVEWFTEIALWDAECSVLSGNIEVRTPAFRFAYPVACSVSGGVFRRHGRVVPDGAPVGLRFPFQPRRTPVVPGRRGDAEARNAEPANADFGTGFAAAGFDSAFHMRSRYCTAVWEQSPILRRSPGAMLHLPCGDGLLLQLARDVNPGLVPFGLERDAELVNRARQRHSHHSGNFLACDWLSDPSAIWQEDAMLVFLDPEPLIDLPNEQRASLLGRLARSAGAIVLVGSDRGLQRYGEVTALARAIGIEAVAGPTERVSALAQVTSRDGERIVPSVYRRKAQRGQHD